MCGIAGMVSRHTVSHEQVMRVSMMGDALKHRGPDGRGEYRNPHAAMAMQRLSIIDVHHGWQPLYNEDRSVVLVANGEIYNYLELRKELEGRGHSFRSGSDCEVIPHLYEEFGDKCLQYLRGMFAFALWDEHKKCLFLARDRMGEKPLYIYEKPGELYFASEFKSVMKAGFVPFNLDPKAIDLYFHYNFVPEPMTPVQGVRKLPAGHFLKVTVDPWQKEESCYWRMEDAQPLTGNPGQLIREQLEQVSELVIRSDVPVGVALSGGLDSSILATMATRRYPGKMHAFSVGYAGRPPSDERADAKTLAEHLDLPFHEIELTLEDVVSNFSQLNYWRDDPIGDISGLGYYSVMKSARDHGVAVMLQGHGGDELFWGYPWVRQAAEQTKRKAARSANGTLLWPNYLLPKLPSESSNSMKEWVRSWAGMRQGWVDYQRDRRSPIEQTIFFDLTPDFVLACASLPSLYSHEFKAALGTSGAYEIFSPPLPWDNPEILITRLICHTYLMENGIAQGDRLSMASSVEVRLPLLDYRLIETVIGLRKTYSDLALPPKAWLKSAVHGIVPDWVLSRPKRGFAPPVIEWHRALFSAYGNSIKDGVLVEKGVLDERAGRDLALGPFPRGAIAPLSFKALILEQWARHYLV